MPLVKMRSVSFGLGPNTPQSTEAVNLQQLKEQLDATIKIYPNFPKPGIMFKDITPVLREPKLLAEVLTHFASLLKGKGVKYIAGIESRGFLLGVPLAQKMGIGFVPLRKPGKLPGEVEKQAYTLEYGTDALEVQKGAIEPGAKVAIIDDLLATGGTAAAAKSLMEKIQAQVQSILFLVELKALNGRAKLGNAEIHALIADD